MNAVNVSYRTMCRLFFCSCMLLFLLLSPCRLFAAPSFSLSSKNWNAGTIKEGTAPKGTVMLRNTGDAPLHVNARPSCECISISPREFTIPPGRKARLSFSIDTRNSFGRKSDYIFFVTDDPSKYTFMWPIECQVIPAKIRSSARQQNR